MELLQEHVQILCQQLPCERRAAIRCFLPAAAARIAINTLAQPCGKSIIGTESDI
jgi:hypothetical protein